jgi:hypothetical protein
MDAMRRSDPLAGHRRDDRPGSRINLDAVMASPGALDPQAAARALDPIESTLLRLVLVHPELQSGLRDRLAPDGLITTPARELWRAVLADRDADPAGTFQRDRFLGALDPTLEALARTLYARTDPLPDDTRLVEQAIDQCLLTLERRGLAERIEYTRAELAEAEATGETETRSALMREIVELEGSRADLDRRIAGTSLLGRFKRVSESAATSEQSTENEPVITATGGIP